MAEGLSLTAFPGKQVAYGARFNPTEHRRHALQYLAGPTKRFNVSLGLANIADGLVLSLSS